MPNKDNSKKTLHNIRTFKTDLAEAEQKQEVSLSDIYQRQQKAGRTFTDPQKKNGASYKKLLLIGSGFLMLVILAGGFFFLLSKKTTTTTQQDGEMKIPQSMIITQQKIILETETKEDFESQLKKLTSGSFTIGNFAYLPVKKGGKYLKTKEFLNFTETGAPTFLTSALEDDFFLGMLSLEKNYPLLIFKIKKDLYTSALSGMIKWEKQLPQKLEFLLTTQIKETEAIFGKFEDKIIKNQNARVLEQENKIILFYAIFDKNYLIITTDPNVLEETLKQITGR